MEEPGLTRGPRGHRHLGECLQGGPTCSSSPNLVAGCSAIKLLGSVLSHGNHGGHGWRVEGERMGVGSVPLSTAFPGSLDFPPRSTPTCWIHLSPHPPHCASCSPLCPPSSSLRASPCQGTQAGHQGLHTQCPLQARPVVGVPGLSQVLNGHGNKTLTDPTSRTLLGPRTP